jgi:aminocarboxymuconate-semialdehyde decarboxylase
LVELLLARYGADRLLLGTDYPFDMGLTDPLGLLASTRMGQREREMAAGVNAAGLFGLS